MKNIVKTLFFIHYNMVTSTLKTVKLSSYSTVPGEEEPYAVIYPIKGKFLQSWTANTSSVT